MLGEAIQERFCSNWKVREVEGEEKGEEADDEGADGVGVGTLALGDDGEQDRAR
jgi:hypothetical protein